MEFYFRYHFVEVFLQTDLLNAVQHSSIRGKLSSIPRNAL